MSTGNYKQELNNSTSIRQEIQRFEGVHPDIYAVYELLDSVADIDLQNQIRDHIINIEDSFVNSQEWTLSRAVPEIRLGILGSISSGKSALVHRYLTGSYVQEESPEGGRFKKEIVVDGQSYLLLVRDEGGPPEIQFSSWVDGLIFVFSLNDEASFHSVYNYYRKFVQYRNASNVPVLLVGTQDSITPISPRVIFDDRAKKLAHDLKHCVYYETCATYGLNVDRVFHDVAQKISLLKRKLDLISSTHLLNHASHLQRSVSTSSGMSDHRYGAGSPVNGYAKSLHGGESTSSLSIIGLLTPTPLRKSSRRKSNLFSSSRKSSESDEKKRFNDLGFGRNIPVKQGWLLKRTSKTKISNKEWKKKYVVLEDDGRLTYYSSMHDYRENTHRKSLSVVRTTIKVPGKHPAIKSSPNLKAESNFEFHLVSMDGVTWHFLSSCANERDNWVSAIERQIMLSLQNHSPFKRNMPSEKSFSEITGNTSCVDCGALDPTWASLNLGCLMCIECSGIHRNLGTHISRVRSLELDDVSPECAAVLQRVGNMMCNSIWEGGLTAPHIKPTPSSSREEREAFIREKYEKKAYLATLPAKYDTDKSSSLCYAIADGNYHLIMHLLAHITRQELNTPVGTERQAALHVASSLGDLASIQLLLWLRANPNMIDSLGETPMALAEQNRHDQCYKLIAVSKTSFDDADNDILPQNCREDVTSNGVTSRPHVNYMYTSAI